MEFIWMSVAHQKLSRKTKGLQSSPWTFMAGFTRRLSASVALATVLAAHGVPQLANDSQSRQSQSQDQQFHLFPFLR